MERTLQDAIGEASLLLPSIEATLEQTQFDQRAFDSGLKDLNACLLDIQDLMKDKSRQEKDLLRPTYQQFESRRDDIIKRAGSKGHTLFNQYRDGDSLDVERGQIQDDTRTLAGRIQDSLNWTRAEARNVLSTGQSTRELLYTQGERVTGISRNLETVDSGVWSSRRLIDKIRRGNALNRLYSYAIIAVLLILIILVIMSKFR